MRRRHRTAYRPRSTWHPLFIRALRYALPRPYFRVHSELQLNHEPLRLDAAIFRRQKLPLGLRSRGLQVLFELLGEITLVSLKGAHDRAGWEDLLHLLSAAMLFCVQEEHMDPAQVRLLLVTPCATEAFWAQIRSRGGSVSPVAQGVAQVRILGHLLYVLHTEEVQDRVLRIFSRSFVQGGLLRAEETERLLTEEERAIFMELVNEIEQFQDRPAVRLRYPDIEEVKMSLEEFYDAILAKVSVEKRLKGLPPEDRLKGLPPEDRLKGLPPEDRLKGLPPEDRLKGLSPEDRDRLLQLLLGQRS